MENSKFKFFEGMHKEKTSKACIDTVFSIYGDKDFSLTATQNSENGKWSVETCINGEVIFLLEYETIKEVITYLATKEDNFIPAIGIIYDDLMHVVHTKGSGVFNASSEVLYSKQEEWEINLVDSPLLKVE